MRNGAWSLSAVAIGIAGLILAGAIAPGRVCAAPPAPRPAPGGAPVRRSPGGGQIGRAHV